MTARMLLRQLSTIEREIEFLIAGMEAWLEERREVDFPDVSDEEREAMEDYMRAAYLDTFEMRKILTRSTKNNKDMKSGIIRTIELLSEIITKVEKRRKDTTNVTPPTS